MMVFRAAIHGHRVEFRLGDFGGESIVVNGREVSSIPINWNSRGHFIELNDEQGKARAVELRRRSRNFKYEVIVSVDGQVRAVLLAEKDSSRPSCCVNCGYELAGLPIENGEKRCPECGRHTSA
ncbi:MAG: hypothetical protein IT434_16260 [Phycisphaerales bacterium]|jgi:predicted Zn-ribbon and HTH transcriptional regulator|nr:hypothetical protein [Phycisphaerales bacterium]